MTDVELANQLYAFMQSIPMLWTWDNVAEMHRNEGSHVEYRGPQEKPMCFDFRVLEIGEKNGRTYLHVAVAVTDPQRDKSAKRGRAWVPLASSFLWYRNGELDMPTVREIC